MKVSVSSKKEPKSKIVKLEQKLDSLKVENSRLRKQNRDQRKRIKALEKSRDNWKLKNKDKALKNKGLQRRLVRQDKPQRHHYGLAIIQLCIMLRVCCGCSYRSICKIMKVLSECLGIGWEKIPCANTVENWVSKLGLHGIQNAPSRLKGQPVCVVMDESLKVSGERVLLLLLSSSRKKQQGALRQPDVEVGYLSGNKTWTGESIEQQVSALLDSGNLKLTHILSDEDSKLLKATRLLGVPHLPDINHAMANCLRNIYKKNEPYQEVIKLIGSYAGKSANQALTYLRPPSQRIKARFMNQKPVINWALAILDRFDQLNEKEANFFKEMKNHKGVLLSLKQCIDLCEQLAQPLKTLGLNLKTLQAFNVNLAKAKKAYPKDQLIISFIKLLEKYPQKYQEFLKKLPGNYNVSSDVIESLFGTHKNLAGTNKLVGVSLLDLQLAVHCKTEKEIIAQTKTAMESIFIADLSQWRINHSYENQALKRQAFFKSG